MATIPFYLVDVFAERKYAGNQLAVFVDWEGLLSEEAMQQIAHEINFAESTFIQGDLGDHRYRVRIFTPSTEMPFAGHPSLGTGYILAKRLSPTPLTALTLALRQSDVPIRLVEEPENGAGELVFLTQTQATFGPQFSHAAVAAALDIPLAALDTAWPVQLVDTGVPYCLVPLRSLADIEALQFTESQLVAFQKDKIQAGSVGDLTKYPSVFFFTPHAYEAGHHFNTRMFHSQHRVLVEDAATGSANACFLAYLLQHHAPQVDVVVEQGYQMQRPSCLYLRGERTPAGHFTIGIGGRVQSVGQGMWFV